MIDWRPHKIWLGILLGACIWAVASGPLLGIAHDRAVARLTSLEKENQHSVESLHQLQQDIADSERMKDRMDMRETQKILAPADRLRAARLMEQRASEAHLTRFTYTLSPEQKILIDTVGSGKQELAVSKITLSAKAPTDTDAYLFIDSLIHTMPGRFSLRAMDIERASKDGPVTDANLKLDITGEWLANSAQHDLAEAP